MLWEPRFRVFRFNISTKYPAGGAKAAAPSLTGRQREQGGGATAHYVTPRAADAGVYSNNFNPTRSLALPTFNSHQSSTLKDT